MKLSTMDYVLSHLEGQYFEEESDKVHYFTTELGPQKTLLPSRVYRPVRSTRPPSARYFVNQFPIYRNRQGGMVFTYITTGATPLEAFSSYLENYLPLFDTLKTSFRVVFVSDGTVQFEHAERVFRETVSPSLDDVFDHEVLNYFDIRRQWEEKNFKGWTKESCAPLRSKAHSVGDAIESVSRNRCSSCKYKVSHLLES